MQFNQWRVSTKLWCTLGGLLAMMLSVSLWTQHNASQTMHAGLQTQADYNHRIVLAQQWKGATETTGERVLTSNMTTDDALTALMDARVKAGVAVNGQLQAQVVKLAQSDADKQALATIASARTDVLALNKQAREIKNGGDIDVMRSFIEQKYLGAIGHYVGSLDAFVKLQEQQRDESNALTEKAQQRATWLARSLQGLMLLAGLGLAFVLTRSITQPLAEAVQLTNAIAQGDLTVSANHQRQDEFGQLLSAVSTMAERLRALVSDVRDSVHSISTASSEIASGNHDLSARTEQTAANLEETAASMEQLTATVAQAADTSQQANQLASNAAQAAEHGGSVVKSVVVSMGRINDSAHRISNIIGVIDSIAFQTNILALNAAVEAARAGEQGRGFAVVASEVRALAHRSADAAKEIKALIATSVDAVNAGTEQVSQAGLVMENIVSSVQKVSHMIGEISASSTEQRDGINQVNQAVTHLDQMTQQNAALVEESTAAAVSLHDQAQRLTGMVAVFKVGESAASYDYANPAMRALR
ncbi:HAMP domain-containing protein [Comamonas sp. Y33R10-2]|uniref:methyl-accepting chemotaxis protein n=1 Tax=Comamonas sp. Y33R10-2 TaxID=2853257 RepID=UPI001C5CA240|nr:methyl-accepting chemotaxis protein [Comamonas sp. Y33R10-2]QXZ11170.1 HAMP domain-containing protein [Comamonas sp. Y33R10-2]